jgi:paraquat-inducible protein A
MPDVFLLSVAVALMKFGTFGTIIPGPGITAFAAVVVLTLHPRPLRFCPA